jgi:DNA-binding response OmpR family regulator
MDIRMPVMDGYAATERIRQLEAENGQPHRPIIALTADAFEKSHQHCLAVGMDDFLTKPIASINALKTTLRKWLPAEQEVQHVSASHSPAEIPIDIPRVAAILRELEPLLAQNKFGALSRFKELQLAVAGTDIATEIDETEWLVADFQFDQALDRLRRLAVAQNWEKTDS